MTALEFPHLSAGPSSARGGLDLPVGALARRSSRTPGPPGRGTVPDEATSVGRILQLPPTGPIPAPQFRGAKIVVVEAALAGSEAYGAALMAAAARARAVIADTFATMPAAALQELHMDPPMPGSGPRRRRDPEPLRRRRHRRRGRGRRGRQSARRCCPSRCATRAASWPSARPGNGALAAIPGPFVTFGVGMAADPGMTAAVEERIDLVASALAPTTPAAAT